MGLSAYMKTEAPAQYTFSPKLSSVHCSTSSVVSLPSNAGMMRDSPLISSSKSQTAPLHPLMAK